MMDVNDPADDIIRTIRIAQGLSRSCIEVRVRKFNPKDGDVLHRPWNHNGVAKRVEIEPYCLADIQETAESFNDYLCKTALDGLIEAAHSSHELIYDTYVMTRDHATKLVHQPPGGCITLTSR